LVSIKSSHSSLKVAIEDTSEAVVLQLKQAVTTGKFTISVDGIYMTVERSSLKHLSSQFKCSPGSVLSTTKKGCGKCKRYSKMYLLWWFLLTKRLEIQVRVSNRTAGGNFARGVRGF